MKSSSKRRAKRRLGVALLCLSAVVIAGARQEGDTLPPNALWLDSLPLTGLEQDWGEPRAGRSVDDHSLMLGGKMYRHGIGTHASSELYVDLKGAATRFVADVGVDDEKKDTGSVVFTVYADDKQVAQTTTLRGGDAPVHLDVNLAGAKQLRLVVSDAGDGIDSDHADWGGAYLVLVPGATAKPTTAESVANEPVTPIDMGPDSPQPAIHGPRVVGTTPNRPFLFRIPTTGQAPLSWSVRHLPPGVSLNARTGILSGSVTQKGTFVVDLFVSGPKGASQRKLVIESGPNKLARTPPLGWNSWNVWGTSVNAEKVRAAADSFVASGLADHGFAYVNIDDGWEGKRGDNGVLSTNEKFGDMAALASYVHSKGLKLGVYSSPGPQTCAGYAGSFAHEKTDVDTWADWGVDYVKYDWCSYGNIAPRPSRGGLVWPYRVLQRALNDAKRDIVFSLCQYGMGNVWEWGKEVDGNVWRTTGDIEDNWRSMSRIGFSQQEPARYAEPGHWNDPDMLVVGRVGWGPNLRPTRLLPNEQITHVSLWSLLASPLLIGCDLTNLDPFTRALLTNDEVLDINQDPLGRSARRVAQNGTTEVWARPLFDGTVAVGLFNRGPQTASVTAKWKDLPSTKLTGKQPVRNVWLKTSLGIHADGFTANVPGHGTLLLKIGKPQRTDYVP